MELRGVFSLASLRADWLLAKQRVIGENLANANSPAYKPRSVSSFAQSITHASGELKSTHSTHIRDAAYSSRIIERNSQRVGSTVSGNDVNIRHELTEMADTRGAYSLNSAIIKSFHRMYLMSVKVGG